MHSAAIVPEHRFGHEGCRLAVIEGSILHDVLEEHDVVGGSDESVESEIDFALAATGDLMVVHFRLDTDRLKILDYVGPQILKRVNRRDRNISFFVADPVAQVILSASLISGAFPLIGLINVPVDFGVI